MRSRDIVGEPAEQLVARASEDLPDEVPHGQVDRSTRDLVPGDRAAAFCDELGPQRVDTDQPVVKAAADGVDDRGLGLAVGVRPRLRLGVTDQAGVGVHTHQHVVRAVHASRGELWRAAVRQRERNRLHRSDLDRAGERRGGLSRRGIGTQLHLLAVSSRPRSQPNGPGPKRKPDRWPWQHKYGVD